MRALADDATATGVADRASILQYLLDVRDGKITPRLDLGMVTIDAATGTTDTVTITNERSRELKYTDLLISPNNGFSVVNQSCPLGIVVGGGSCTLTVRFRPQTTSPDTPSRSATLSLKLSGTLGDPDPGSRTVSLTGTAPKSLEITPPLPFAVTLSSSFRTQTVTIANRLNSTLQLCLTDAPSSSAPGDFNLDGRIYDAGTQCARVAPPVGNQDVTFTPKAVGSRQALFTAQRVSDGALVGPREEILLQGNPGPFMGISGAGYANETLFASVIQDINAGTAARSVVALSNIGNETLRVSSIGIPRVADAGSDEYMASGCTVGTLPVGASCNLSVSFDPTNVGTRTTTLTISYSNAANTPASSRTASINLRGQGTRGAGLLVSDAGSTTLVTGSPVAFGRQNIAIAYTRRLTLTNTGSDEGLTILAPTTVPGAAGFDLVAPSGGGGCGPLATGFVLAAGISCVVDVRFSPTAVTNYSTNLTLPSRPIGAVTAPINFVLNLSGEGVDGRPTLQWQTAAGGALSLLEVPGITAVGSATPPQVSLRLANSGPGAAALQLLNVIGADASSFTIEATGPGRCDFGNAAALLLEGTSCEVVIAFQPQTAGAKAARLQLVSTGTTPAPVEIRAQASGPAATFALMAIPASINLNSVRVGAQSAPATITLANDGAVSAVVTAVDASSGFAFEPGTCGALPFSIGPRSSCTLSIRFAPSGTGATSGSLRVQVSGVVAPVEVALQGTGTAAADISGGGCSISDGRSPADPTLWALVLLAAAVLFYRRMRRGSESDDWNPRQDYQ